LITKVFNFAQTRRGTCRRMVAFCPRTPRPVQALSNA